MPNVGATGAAGVHVAAPAERVRTLVRDVTRMPAWSPEVVRVRWRGGGPPPEHRAVGARFVGWSRIGPLVWPRTCVIEVDEPHAFVWRTLPTWWNRDATRWRFDLAATDAGTWLTLSSVVLVEAPWFIAIGTRVTGRGDRLPDHLTATVRAIAAEA